MAVQSFPPVSVILPTYNRATTIRASIDSVLRQTWTEFELLVVDDGSTDSTLEIIQNIRDSRLKILTTPRNLGPSGARNIGIRAARGTWVAFQDSDDEWMPDKLTLQMARLEEPGAPWIAAYCGMIIVGSVVEKQGRTRIRYIPDRSVDPVEGAINTSLLETSFVSTQMLIARREDLENLGGFDENLPSMVDWDLVLRLSQRGQVAFVDEPLVLQRFSPNSITHDQARRTVARAQIIHKHRDQMSLVPGLLARQYRALAGEYRRLSLIEDALKAIQTARRTKPFDPGLMIRDVQLRFWVQARRMLGTPRR